MNKNFIVCTVCLGMLLSITGFVLATDSTNYPVLSCTNGANGCDAQILVGDKFSISLDGNASTGYQWNLSYDTSFLNLDSSNSVSLCPPVSSEGIDMIGVGCGQTTSYNFSALKTGTVKITATYSRPWESIQPAQINYYNINISAVSINGVCGSANGMTFSSIPTINLCSTGIASNITGSGPWFWSCTGSMTSSCSALAQPNNNLKIGSLTLDKPLSQMNRNELLIVLIRFLQTLYGSMNIAR